MRGIYHRSTAIEAFLERYPVPITPAGANVYFHGKATEVFEDLLQEGPGQPPTVKEFVDAYWQQQSANLLEHPGATNRMIWLYIGLIRDYHVGALLVECPRISHVFWHSTLDADGGVDYILCINRRYGALHVRTDDPLGWTCRKQQRKSAVQAFFPYHVDLIVPRQAHTKGNVWLCRSSDVERLAQQVGREGARRPVETRVWEILKMHPIRFITPEDSAL